MNGQVGAILLPDMPVDVGHSCATCHGAEACHMLCSMPISDEYILALGVHFSPGLCLVVIHIEMHKQILG